MTSLTAALMLSGLELGSVFIPIAFRNSGFSVRSLTSPFAAGVSNDFFNMLYEVLLGEKRGPRFGSFIALYGVAETRKLIADALACVFVSVAT